MNKRKYVSPPVVKVTQEQAKKMKLGTFTPYTASKSAINLLEEVHKHLDNAEAMFLLSLQSIQKNDLLDDISLFNVEEIFYKLQANNERLENLLLDLDC